MVAETSNGEQVAIPVNDESLELMQCDPITTAIEGDVCIEDVEFAEEVDPSEFEVVEIYEDQKLIRFPDGKVICYHIDSSKEDILDYKAYHDATAELDEEYIEWQLENVLAEQEKYDLEHNIKRVKIESILRTETTGCFTTVPSKLVTPQPDGSTLIEEWEEDVFVTHNGSVFCASNIDEMIEFYEKYKDHVELHDELISQQHKCNKAFDELKRNDEKYTLEQVSFICAYITYAMEQFMEAQELTKLHHNARAWAIDPTASFNAVQLRSDHLSKEDLKHLGYNVGKFLRLRGEIIARFVKHVFEEPFGTTHIRTIVAKLADRNPEKDRIPLLSANAMDQLFAHYKRYGNINLNIIKDNKKR